jgi:hypothetical protein
MEYQVFFMPHQHQWLIPNHIIIGRNMGDLTIEDIEDSTQALVNMLNSSSRPLVHVLIDLTELESHPNKLKPLAESSKAIFNHPKLGWLLLYGNLNRFSKFLAQMFAQLSHIRFRIFTTDEEAIEFLKSVDVTLEEVPEIGASN